MARGSGQGWQGYPDSRLVVDAAGRDLLGFLRDEISSGQLGAEARVLHVARSYQPWASLPIAVFTGLEESVVSEDATVDIFTAGGRIYAARASGRLVVPSLEPRQGGLSRRGLGRASSRSGSRAP